MILLLPYSVYPAISVGNPKINSNVNQIKTIPLNMDELPLPRTARDIFRLSLKDRLIFGSVTAFNRWTGRWRYPVAASGDLETMKKIDIIYWLYKAEFPHTRAVKDSGLEAFFERQKSFQYSLPVNYTIANELKLSAAGDLMDHPYLSNSSATLYQAVADTIFNADISMANLECVIYTDSKPFVIKLPESPPLIYTLPSFNVVKGFQNRKFTFVATANNHSLDCGEVGVRSTIQTLKQEGISFHGTNETEKDSSRASIIEKNGFKIGLISHTFGLNAKKPPREKPWIVNRTLLNENRNEIDFEKIEKQIQFCHESKVDAIIGHLHWGMEHEYYPRPKQLDVAHHLAEMGLDVIIGHHPHLIQPTEHYRTQRDPQRVVPIYYSLGNLINPFSDPRFCLGGVAQVKLVKGTDQTGHSRTYVKSAELAEVFQEIDLENKKISLVRKKKERS